jgi:hypothetical protein
VAFTSEQLSALEAAASTGALTVKFADRLGTYQSLSDLLEAIKLARRDVSAASGSQSRRIYLEHGRGY